MDVARQSVRCLWEAGMWKEAGSQLEVALASTNDNEIHWCDHYRLAWILFNLGKYREVLEFIQVRQSVSSPMGKLFLKNLEVMSLAKLGRDQPLVKALSQARLLLSKVCPEDSNDYESKNVLPDWWRPPYQAETLSENFDKLEATLVLMKGDLKTHKELSPPKHSLLKEIQEQFLKQNYFQCLTLIEKVKTNVYMEKAQLFEVVAACYFELEREAELYGVAQASMADFPESSTAFFTCGLYYQLVGKKEDARKALLYEICIHSFDFFRMATRKNQTSIEAMLALGHAYASIGDHDQAIASYANIVKSLDDSCIPAYLSYASEFLRVRKPAAAAPSIHQALSINRDDPFALNELGVLLYLRRDWSQAIQAFTRAISIISLDPHGQYLERTLRENLQKCQLRLAIHSRDLTLIKQLLSLMKPPIALFYRELMIVMRAGGEDDNNENVAPLLAAASRISDRKRSLRIMERLSHNSPF